MENYAVRSDHFNVLAKTDKAPRIGFGGVNFLSRSP